MAAVGRDLNVDNQILSEILAYQVVKHMKALSVRCPCWLLVAPEWTNRETDRKRMRLRPSEGRSSEPEEQGVVHWLL